MQEQINRCIISSNAGSLTFRIKYAVDLPYKLVVTKDQYFRFDTRNLANLLYRRTYKEAGFNFYCPFWKVNDFSKHLQTGEVELIRSMLLFLRPETYMGETSSIVAKGNDLFIIVPNKKYLVKIGEARLLADLEGKIDELSKGRRVKNSDGPALL